MTAKGYISKNIPSCLTGGKKLKKILSKLHLHFSRFYQNSIVYRHTMSQWHRYICGIAKVLFLIFFLSIFSGCGKIIAEPNEMEYIDEIECGKVLYPETDIFKEDLKACTVINTEELFFEPEDLLSSLNLNQDMEMIVSNNNIIQYTNTEQKDCFLTAYIEDGKKVVINYNTMIGRMILQMKYSTDLQENGMKKVKSNVMENIEEFLEKLGDTCADYVLEKCYYYNNNMIQDYLERELRELRMEEDCEEAEIQTLETQLQTVQDKKTSGYYMEFQAKIGDRRVDSGIIQTNRGIIYKPPKITICYTPNEGIVYAEIFHIRKPLKKTNISATVSGKDALNYVKKMYNNYTVENSGIKFEKMELNYIVMPLDGDKKELQYVPAWIFYGIEYIYNEQGELLFLQEKNVRINAITGVEVL